MYIIIVAKMIVSCVSGMLTRAVKLAQLYLNIQDAGNRYSRCFRFLTVVESLTSQVLRSVYTAELRKWKWLLTNTGRSPSLSAMELLNISTQVFPGS
jgi:hypothetical protein